MPHLSDRRPRRGTTLVEFAMVVVVFFMILFGIVEYARLIFVYQVMLNAAREGAHYAVVNSTDTNLVADTQAVVLQKMTGVNTATKNYSCQVYAADSSGNNTGTPTSAQFGQLIGVQIDCDFNPIVPSLLLMNKTVHLTTKTLMYSEAN